MKKLKYRGSTILREYYFGGALFGGGVHFFKLPLYHRRQSQGCFKHVKTFEMTGMVDKNSVCISPYRKKCF